MENNFVEFSKSFDKAFAMWTNKKKDQSFSTYGGTCPLKRVDPRVVFPRANCEGPRPIVKFS